ncbi:ABC transporter substrate-binding protein [Rhizobium viscosum]|uniref:Alpha-1,4-digalacturonate transport system substrate-binding protein n=1 Tax=Rhizobium viscosum TaxID=1673 RepID=A0ABR9IX68_RHIVS|nr:extracellular solute-binding protein [Rhizobium viscosum]MBE1507700.1 alpha-1,4-digalacturonate transport system substrate-binding protein [Rhizobium viscosum]
MKPLKTLIMTASALAMTISLAAASELKIVWYVDNDQEETNTRALLDQYTKLHPDTTFDLEITPYDGMVQKFQQYAASGIMPDLSLTSSMEPVIRPFLVDLKKEIGPEWINDFVKGWGDGAKLDDKVIAAPLRVTSTGIFLNVDAFKKAGVAIPDRTAGWTWDEFVPKIKEVAEKSGTRYPLVWDVSASRWIVHEYQYGNHIYTEKEPVKVVMDEAAWTSTLDKFIDITKAAMPPGLWSGASSDNPKEIFTAGQAVAYMSGSWQIAGLADNAHFAWQAGPTPRGTVASSIYGGDYLVAFNTSQHLPEAIDFIKWITSPEIQGQYAKTFGMIPANLKAAAVKYDNPAATEAITAMQGELNASPAYAATDQAWPQMQAVWGTVKTAVTQAVAGQITSAEAISQIKKAADASLEASK